MDSYDSMYKAKAQRAKSVEFRGEPIKNGIVFPSRQALDLLQGFENGLFDENTNLVCVERKKEIAEILGKKFGKKFPNIHVVNDHFHKIDFSKYFQNGSIDYVNFDICGWMSFDIMAAFERMQYLFAPIFRFHATLSAVMRHPDSVVPYMTEIMAASSGHRASYGFDAIDWLNQYCQKNNTNEENTRNKSDKMMESIAYQLAMLANMTTTHCFVISRFSVYRNRDLSNMASHMVAIDCDYVTDLSQEIGVSGMEWLDEAYSVREEYADFAAYFREKTESGEKNTEIIFEEEGGCCCSQSSRGIEIDVPLAKSRKYKRSGLPVQKTSYRRIFKISNRKDLHKKLLNPGVKAAITRLANKNGTTSVHIVAGIKRELTCEESR